ncbi:MAG: penicillin-binding protein 1C [Bacteroidota bacterium]
MKLSFLIKTHRPKLRRRYLLGIVGLIAIGTYLFSLPKAFFHDPESTVLLDKNGELLGARIAEDGQWRFPEIKKVPDKFASAIVLFEDKRFYSHPGVDLLAMGRALRLNFQKGKIVSGGSTISMQVIRLARKGKPRTVWEKVVEVWLATRMELSYSKPEILAMYASHAPFGGNIVGLEAAAWKYFSRSPENLSWSESAMLAVLPNAPGLIHPGKNRNLLLQKRNQLLDRLVEKGKLDQNTAFLAKSEPLPEKPTPIPQHIPHLLDYVQKGALADTKHTYTTLDIHLQKEASKRVENHVYGLASKGINNAAAIITEVETGDILAYVGNVSPFQEGAETHSYGVDITQARRSSGSILKPVLYAAMIQSGELLPEMLVPDIPSQYGGYTPLNYSLTYDGAIPAWKALARSLNIPTVHLLSRHGVSKFYAELQQCGITTLHRRPQEYGLTLALGGAEVTLVELAAMYAGMARNLKHFSHYKGKYEENAFRPINLWRDKSKGKLNPGEFSGLVNQQALSAAATWFTFEAMLELTRPETDQFWKQYQSSRKIAWKTGTSFGFRDAWAVGLTPEYVVSVWVGNADGEGRPGLIGAQAAAPLMFSLFQMLPDRRQWFQAPLDEMQQIATCRKSGHLAGRFCPEADTSWVQTTIQEQVTCPYHKKILLGKKSGLQVNRDCIDQLEEAITVPWFILPPAWEKYYKRRHPDYLLLPAWTPGCKSEVGDLQMMQWMYPRINSSIYIPVELDGKLGKVVFELAHRQDERTVFWHLDEAFVGQTTGIHKLSLQPNPGDHTLTVVDDLGNSLSREFTILSREAD